MRRAAVLVVAALAGCGGGRAGDEAKPSAPTTTQTVTPTPTPTPSAASTQTPSPTPTAARPAKTARPSRGERRHAVTEAIRRYLTAVNARDTATPCAGFAEPTPLVCGGPGRHLPERPVLDGPAFVRLEVTEAPRVERSGRRARAIVRFIVVDDEGEHARREVLRLRIHRDAWAVYRPSPVFYRAINRRAP